MTRFLTTTATALILSTAAHAGGHMNAFSEMQFDAKTNLLASDLIGARVYATEADIANDMVAENDAEKEWDDIGEINEIVLTRGGDVTTVILGVGGFLGMGEKDVAIDMSQIKFVSDGEDADDYFLVVSANAAGIQEAPAYSLTAGGLMDREMMKAPMVKRDGFETVMSDDLNTEELTGARVYGANDEDVGEISELLLTNDGKLDRAVIDVGGFLGMGERPVAVTMNELHIIRNVGGDDIRVYIDSTKDTLKSQPEYNG